MNRTEVELAKMTLRAELLTKIHDEDFHNQCSTILNSYSFGDKIVGISHILVETIDVINFFGVLTQEVLYEYSIPHEVWLLIFASLSKRHKRRVLEDQESKWCFETVKEHVQYANPRVCLWYVSRGELSMEDYNTRFGGMSYIEFREWFPTKASCRDFEELLNRIKIIL